MRDGRRVAIGDREVVSRTRVVDARGHRRPSHAETRPIDVEGSTLTVFVYKSGLFSAFADDHVIRAPLASGTISADPPFGVELSVRSANLKVLDPGLSIGKRSEVQVRMLGPEVLDSEKYPRHRICVDGD